MFVICDTSRNRWIWFDREFQEWTWTILYAQAHKFHAVEDAQQFMTQHYSKLSQSEMEIQKA